MSSTPSGIAGLVRTPLVDQRDFVTREWYRWLALLDPKAVVILQFVSSTHAARANILASGYAAGSLYFETDRNVYYLARAGAWQYSSGIFSVNQSDLPTDLGTNDTGFLAYVLDFAHLLQWNGTGWTWAPGELGSDFILPFVTGPDNPIGWQACDGSSNVAKLSPDGTIALVTVPNTAGSFYRQ